MLGQVNAGRYYVHAIWCLSIYKTSDHCDIDLFSLNVLTVSNRRQQRKVQQYSYCADSGFIHVGSPLARGWWNSSLPTHIAEHVVPETAEVLLSDRPIN